jgi:hypothetical protein
MRISLLALALALGCGQPPPDARFSYLLTDGGADDGGVPDGGTGGAGTDRCPNGWKVTAKWWPAGTGVVITKPGEEPFAVVTPGGGISLPSVFVRSCNP